MRLRYWYNSLFLGRNFFKSLIGLTLLFLLGYWWEWIFTFGVFCLVLLLFMLIWDVQRLYGKGNKIIGKRILPEKLSNGDENHLEIILESRYPFSIATEVIDELPAQFQVRDFLLRAEIMPGDSKRLIYTLTPRARGEYNFGELHVFVQSPLGLLRRRFSMEGKVTCKVYPSFIHMRKFAFMTLHQKLPAEGIKSIRKLGQSLEFEHIKEYVSGDDIRTMNWKATAKRANLMVNVFQEPKSQPIYVLLDTGRTMKMPFNGLTLLDYGVNSALAFANVGLKMRDKVGLLCFSKNLHYILPASNRKDQLGKFSDSLYRLETGFPDSDFGHLYAKINRNIPTRSLLVLFTNFEHVEALKRQLPYLQALNRKHLLVVVIFENTVLSTLARTKAGSIPEVYQKTIAQKLTLEKKQMILEMERRGVSCLLTPPEQLTVNTINQYLWIKAKNLL
jgi:uncharacterized protein (DUF58 family)